MNNEVLVKVEGKKLIAQGYKHIPSELFGITKNGQLRKDEFWAVDDVSHDVSGTA